MLGDALFLVPETGRTVIIPGEVWAKWEDNFVKVMLASERIQLRKDNNYRIARFDTWWDKSNFMNSVFIDYADWLVYFVEPNSPLPGIHTHEFHSRMLLVFDRLRESPKVRATIQTQLKTMAQQTAANNHTARDEVMMSIRINVDREIGLPVEFIIPNNCDSSLYYIVGKKMWYIPDVLSPEDEKVIGTVVE